MKTRHIEFSDEYLITPSGLVFVGQILGKSNFVKKVNRAPISSKYLQKHIKNDDILLTYIGMLCQGKPQYEAVLIPIITSMLRESRTPFSQRKHCGSAST